jgi:hypothetical protein
VDVLATAVADLRGVVRLGRGLASGAIPVGTLRRQATGPDPAGPADRAGPRAGPVLAGVPPRLPGQLARFAAVGVASTVAYLLLYLVLRGAVGAQPANALALVSTAVANTAANRRLTFRVRGRARAATHQVQGLAVFTLLRFVLFRGWIFRSARGPAAPAPVPAPAAAAPHPLPLTSTAQES